MVALHIVDMRRAVVRHGFDGQWYLRAYDAQGRKVGSRENEEGQIFAEPQGFCAMAGIGEEEGLCHRALDSVAERLLSRFGIVLQQPAYSRYYAELGEISSYPPGYKENAGIFCHNNPWIMIAEAKLRRGSRAYDYYRRLAPAFLDDCQDIHRTEPYVYAQMIAGPDAAHSGQAKNSWLTGTAAWNYAAITQFMLGIRPEHNGLRIDPVIAREIGSFQVTRRCRGAEYRIFVDLEAGGVESELYVDGTRLETDIVPYAAPGTSTTIECRIRGRGIDAQSRNMPRYLLTICALVLSLAAAPGRGQPLGGNGRRQRRFSQQRFDVLHSRKRRRFRPAHGDGLATIGHAIDASTILSFNKLDTHFSRAESNEFPASEYDRDPVLPFAIDFVSPRSGAVPVFDAPSARSMTGNR